MADNNYKTITRIIEYHGPVEWLESTMANSRVAIQGTMQFKNGVYIKSGVINWQPDEATGEQAGEPVAVDGTIQAGQGDNVEPSVKTVPFKRPGME